MTFSPCFYNMILTFFCLLGTILEEKKSTIKQIKMANKNLKQKRVECKKCGKSFSTNVTLKEHLLRHQGLVYPCTLCDEIFTFKANLRKHVRYQHTDTTLQPCLICKKVIKRGSMSQHLKIHMTDRELYACQKCDAKLSLKDSFRAHLLIHSGQQKKITCKICNTQVSKDNFSRHFKNHKDTSPTFPCRIALNNF